MDKKFSNTAISDIMTTRLVTVSMDDELNVIKEIFDNVSFRHLLVVDDEVLVGVISDRDLLRAISPNAGTLVETARDKSTLAKRTHQIMSREPKTLSVDCTVENVIDLFASHTISCIPVVDADFKPVGIVSWRDLIKLLVSSRT